MKLGLVCISELLREKSPFMAFKTMTRKSFLKEKDKNVAIDTLSHRILHNLTVSNETIKHCASIGVKHYRLSSSIFPLVTDPTLSLTLEHFPRYSEILSKLAEIGNSSKRLNISLSLHPDQYVVLGSNSDDVCSKSIKELNFFGWMLDAMGCNQDYSCPINIHPALSKFESAEGFVDKFVTNFFKCDLSVRSRLVIENEHNGFWNCNNLYDHFHNYVKNKYGFHFPLTLDNWHDHCNPSVDNNAVVPYNSHFLKFYNTWPNVPVFHWSQGKSDKDPAHISTLSLIPPDLGLDVIYEVEVKDKDKGFQHLLPSFNRISV